MAGSDFRTMYHAYLDDVVLSEDAKRRIVEAAEGRIAHADDCLDASERAAGLLRAEKILSAPIRNCSAWRRWMVAAACACIILFACATLLFGGQTGGVGSWFAIEAYASGTDGVGSGEEIVLSRVNDFGNSLDPEDGMYAEAVFTIRGEGITSVDITVSRGELYAFIAYDYVLPGDPRIAQAEAQTGDFAGYDSVSVGHSVLGSGFESAPPKEWYSIALYKKMGSSVHVENEAGGSEESFESGAYGFWIETAPLPEFDEWNPDPSWRATVNQLHGIKLEVTVAYSNGTSETRSYRLKASDGYIAYPEAGIIGIDDPETAMQGSIITFALVPDSTE